MPPSRGLTKTTLALLSTFSATLLTRPASAASIGLPSEIVDFVPSCATSCLSTFIDVNFPSGVCGSKPTFECLCAHTGTSGFTMGEGALACIASEDSVGQCTGTDVSLTASQKAYSMCSGQTSAAPETHATLVATLVIPNQPTKTVTMTAVNTNTNTGKTTNSQTTSSTTTLFFLTSPLPTRTSTSTRKTAATTPSTDSDSVLLTAPPRSDTTVATHPPTTTTNSASDTSSAQTGSTSEQTQPKNKTNSLSVGQIVGISVGTAAALILAIALSIYLSIVRRRRLALVPRLTGDGYKGYNGDRDSDEEVFRQRFRPRTGHELQISVPVNLQAPLRPSSNGGPSWQEKYGPSRTAPQNTLNSNFNTSNNTNSKTQQPENRMDAPLPAPTILITRPTLERAGATAAPEARPARNLTPRTINGQPNGSPRGGMSASPPRAAGTSAAQNAAQMQNSVPPSLAIGRPRTQTANTNTNTYNAESRPTPYPSYYGIPPDDARPSFGYPQRPKDPVPVPPVPARSAQRLSQPQIRTVRPEGALPSVFQPPLNNRDSIVTEFAEDGEDDFSPRVTDGGRYPSRQFSSTSSVQGAPQQQDIPRQDIPRQQFVVQGQRYPAGSHRYEQTQAQTQTQPRQNHSSPRQLRQPLPQFQIQPQHEPQLRPQLQPSPRTPSPRTDNGNGFASPRPSPQPFMSPSLVPRPLDLGSRPAVNQSPPRNGGPITLNMPDGAGSNVSRMAKLRLGDERALNLRLNGDGRSPRPRQNAGWRRMDDGPF